MSNPPALNTWYSDLPTGKTYTIAVTVIDPRQHKVLLAKRNGCWELPSTEMVYGDNLETAMHRALFEATMCRPDKYIGQIEASEEGNGVKYSFAVTLANADRARVYSGYTELKWLNEREVYDLDCPGPMVKALKKGCSYRG